MQRNKAIVDEYVEKPRSVARLIANSHAIKDLYSNFRKKSDEKIPISQSTVSRYYFAWLPEGV